MGAFSNIEWTHHTFNPWWGCDHVSPACDHCYAETWAKRMGHEVWGGEAPRRTFGDKHWNEPLKWDRAAAKLGERQRVFCASMADVFENRRELNVERERLWSLIEVTTNLDWLLLTKRPNMVSKLNPWGRDWPENVWLGTTVENQKWADVRLPKLREQPAAVLFVSAEPLLQSLSLHPYLDALGWVIVGGETGKAARPMKPIWAREVRDQCVSAGVPFHFKQWGDHDASLVRVGKKRAGRLLDGRTWDELPTAA